MQEPRKLDLIDRHAAAASREITRSFELCDSLIASRQWAQVIQRLQYIVDLPEDALVQKGPGWVSAKRLAEERLLALPEEGHRLYQNQYAAVASEELATAHANGDFAALCLVASRFRSTPAGQQAADEAAMLLADAGDLVAAAQWSRELEHDGAEGTTTPEWKSRSEAILEKLVPARDFPRLSSANWTEVYGGPGRWNSVAGDQPLLLEEWSSMASQVPLLQEEVELRQEDLFAAGHRPIPVANVVAAGDLMAVRSLGGVEAREAATGRLLWRTRGRNTAEAVLTREGTTPGASALTLGPADNHEGHPLSSFFYRDAALGQISTDGQRVFVIGRKSALLMNTFDLYGSTDSERREDQAFNTVVALDFTTGRTLWTTGGSSQDAPFESPLSGVYFFGPPTVDGTELFVIGAAGADINLYCLEASTGLPKWKQLIAEYDTTRIEEDFVRQMWACTPAVSQGLIYCPTNAGWLVAVDRHRRRLAWATRYATSEVSDRYQPQYSLSQINERWAQTAPILSGGELVFAPPELPDEPMQTEPHLYRIDAMTGRVKFRRGKAESIAVGGVYGETVVVLGKQGLEGWPPLDRWSTRWSTPYPAGLTPCGLGVAINGVYWLPFLEGAVVGFRLTDGGIEEVLRNDALAGRLGNLSVHGNRVFASGPTGVVGLWQKAPFETQLNDRLARNPRDLEGRIRKARGLVSDQRFEQALMEIGSADLLSAGAGPLAAEARALQWKCLTNLLAGPKADDEQAWTQLEKLGDSPEQKQLVERMRIDDSIGRLRWHDALDRCWRMTESPSGVIEDGGLSVRGDIWLSGRLLEISNHAPEQVQAQLTNLITVRTSIDAEKLDVDGPRTERLIGFHPLGRALSLRLALADADRNELALAEMRLSALSLAPEPGIAAAASTRLADLYADCSFPRDAARMLKIAAGLDRATPLADRTMLGAWLDARKGTTAENGRRSPTSGWSLTGGQVVRLGAERDHETGRSVWVRGRPAEWMAEKRFEFAGSWSGLSMIDCATHRSEWSMPLASNGIAFEEWAPDGTAGGSVLAICSRGVLHVCSPHDRRMLWSWPLPQRFSSPVAYGWAEEQVSNQPVRSLATAVTEFQSNIGSLREGPLMAIAGGRLSLLGQRELVVFDLRTGEELWRRDGMAGSAALVMDEESVCVSATTTGGSAAFRLQDGKRIATDSLATVLKRTFAVEGDTVLTRQGLPRPFSTQVRIVSERPASGKVVWSQVLSDEVMIHHLPGRELAGIEPSGEVFVIDVDTGVRTDVGRLTGANGSPRREMHVLADADRVYVAVERNPSYEFTHVSVPNIMLNGDLYAFDRRERRLVWKEQVRDTSLLTARFADSPVVILAEHSVPERRRKVLDALNLPELKLIVLDKRNGARLIEWAGVTQHGSPAALLLEPAKQRIDLFLNHYGQNFNHRLRLQFGALTTTTRP
ncbi:outer membrane protein assembly factor BamB family protein [Caulifigura coniformis]|uniref:outer membrane protein assembly factor BamB family protein n=1 Tax=Caulifigura coniformis TaxID=2527983 RepID=UPI0018D2632D|nr:PQQ-binding-like beta-propeller repeat protein [Caulifigura coniformis]